MKSQLRACLQLFSSFLHAFVIISTIIAAVFGGATGNEAQHLFANNS